MNLIKPKSTQLFSVAPKPNDVDNKKIFFTTNTSVIHHKAQSSKQNRFVAKQASYQSKIYFYEKNDGLSKKYILKLFIIISAYLELLYLIILYHSSDRVDRIFMQRKVIKCTV